jgi:hypothetical protein
MAAFEKKCAEIVQNATGDGLIWLKNKPDSHEPVGITAPCH